MSATLLQNALHKESQIDKNTLEIDKQVVFDGQKWLV